MAKIKEKIWSRIDEKYPNILSATFVKMRSFVLHLTIGTVAYSSKRRNVIHLTLH
jgi:hypothetical protein